MRELLYPAFGLLAIAAVAPAGAAIVGFAPGASFATSAYKVSLFDGSSYTFSALALSGSDTLYRTAAMATTGSATGYGGGFIGNGTDFTSYSAGSATPGNNFGGDFITAPTARAIDYSLTDTYVALRFGTAGTYYYGYAEVANQTLVRFAYNNVAGGSIATGQAIDAALPSAVPEPATWAMMIAGFAIVGGSVRRRSFKPGNAIGRRVDRTRVAVGSII